MSDIAVSGNALLIRGHWKWPDGFELPGKIELISLFTTVESRCVSWHAQRRQ